MAWFKSERGQLLFSTLILVIFLSLLSLSLASYCRWKLNLQQSLQRQQEIEALMASGISIGSEIKEDKMHNFGENFRLEIIHPESKLMVIDYDHTKDKDITVTIYEEVLIIEKYSFN